jgi:hypothetical protein
MQMNNRMSHNVSHGPGDNRPSTGVGARAAPTAVKWRLAFVDHHGSIEKTVHQTSDACRESKL